MVGEGRRVEGEREEAEGGNRSVQCTCRLSPAGWGGEKEEGKWSSESLNATA